MFFMDFATQRRLGARKFVYFLAGPVPAANAGNAGAALIEEKLQQNWNFWSELLAISFTTLELVSSTITDDGASHLSAKFEDGATQLALCNTFGDLAAIAAPGRQRLPGVAGDPANALSVDGGVPWPHLWLNTGSIKVDLRNDANTPNYFKCAFHGYLIPESNMGLFDQWINGQSIAGNQPGLTDEQLVQGLAGLLGRRGY